MRAPRPALALVLGAASLAVPPLHAQGRGERNPLPRPRAEIVAAIDSIANAFLKDGRAAGMSIAVVKGRDTLALKGYGKADLELDVATPARAVYEIGSVTKQFTAAALLQLQDDGKLSLDDELTRYLPDYPTQGHRVTLRRLLDHTSGIKGYTELPGFGAIMTRKLPKDSLVALFKNEPFDFAPGEGEVYNNSAYFLLGLVIEKVTGKSYADYVKEGLFARAGMADSRYCSESAITPRKAHGYDMGPGGLRNKGYIDHTYPYAAGSLCSTVGDLVAWNRALHGGKILSERAYRELLTPGTLNDGTTLRYAKGLALHTFAGHRTIEHGGGINGYLSSSAYFPDEDAIIVVLINTAGPVSADAVTAALATATFGPATRPSQRYAGNLAELTGTYGGVGRGARLAITVTADSGKLRALFPRNQSAAELRYIGNDTWEIEDTRLTFERKDGKVARVRADLVYGYSYLDRQP
ncbi:MAG TPA: serine hydrolase domain-containing protein [Gemmatimonadaceae bacterium]|nr:serine hydrolase domain-containing protein [Gemmatimonadaceae bacterium]